MTPSDASVHGRANLLPEEQVAGGSADPQAQARAILQDSEDLLAAPTAAPGPDERRTGQDDGYEHRRSEDTL